jgi:hypothetical protein
MDRLAVSKLLLSGLVPSANDDKAPQAFTCPCSPRHVTAALLRKRAEPGGRCR